MHAAFSSVTGWLDSTKVLTLVSLCISISSFYIAWQNRRLALMQERRRLPRLVPTLVHGYYKDLVENGDRIYAFRVTITNPTDSNNAVVTADLSITYLTRDRVQMTMKLRANEPSAVSFVRDHEERLAIPSTIPAHSAVSGWLRFHLPAAMLGDRTIEAYHVGLADPHGETAEIVPILVQEYRDET